MNYCDQHYVVFMETGDKLGGWRRTEIIWSWSRLNHHGLVIVHGTRHPSLEACFASVRKHRIEFGDVPIMIDLKGANLPDAPFVIDFAAMDRDPAITQSKRDDLRSSQRVAQNCADRADKSSSRNAHARIANAYGAQIAAGSP